jgi:hypothetical protein
MGCSDASRSRLESRTRARESRVGQAELPLSGGEVSCTELTTAWLAERFLEGTTRVGESPVGDGQAAPHQYVSTTAVG